MNFLILGLGSIGQRHLRVISERNDVVTAACDLNEEMLEEAKGISAKSELFDTPQRALAWEPDIVIVATPNHLHREWAVNAFEVGAHVLCEKPIADTLADGKAIVEASKGLNRVLAVGYTQRFRPAVRFVRELAAGGSMGTLIGGRAMVGTYLTLLSARSDFREQSFGALLVDYTHEFDYLRWIFGDVSEVVARGHSLGNKEKKTDPSLAAVILTFESGAIVTVNLDYIQHPQRRTMEIYGDRQVAEADLQSNEVRVFDCDRDGYRTIPCYTERDNWFREEHQDMIGAVTDGGPPLVGGEDALAALAIAVSANEQIR